MKKRFINFIVFIRILGNCENNGYNISRCYEIVKKIFCLSTTIDILRLLLENERMYQKEIKDRLGKKGTVDIRLKELELLGIIASEVEDKFQGKKWYWLTERGRKIAEKIIEIEKIMGEE